MKAPTTAAALPCSVSAPWPLQYQYNIDTVGKRATSSYNKGSFPLQGSPQSDYFGRAAHTKGLRHIPELPPALSTEKHLARYSVSREVPCSVLKWETVLGSLDATPKVP